MASLVYGIIALRLLQSELLPNSSSYHIIALIFLSCANLQFTRTNSEINSLLHYTYYLYQHREEYMACVVVLSLMRTLELEFLQPHLRPILQQNELTSCYKLLAQSLHKKLGCLMELFDENRMDGVEAIKDLETKLRDVAFQIEDEIELQVVHLYGQEEEEEEEEGEEDEFEVMPLHMEMPQEKSTHHCQQLHQILHPPTGKSHPCLQFRRILHRAKEEIDAIEEELVMAKMEYNHFIALQGRKTTLDATPNVDDLVNMDNSCKNDASHSQDIMVGKNNEFQTIRKMLIQHTSQQREVVSIQGMGGIGKTTLARRVYEDPSIASHFDKRAWVVASQHHNKRQMLLGLLNSKDNANSSSSDEDLALQLYQSLKHQRYLIVIDDIWSRNAWNDVKSCFPSDRNGSRVLLTTRLAEVATHTCSEDNFSHQMHFLDQSESWDLFYEKACKSKGAEFETIGRPVVKKCKGLPLAIIVVAGLFSKLNTLDEWKTTANALRSSSATTLDDEECSRILSLSYNHLPHNLKACFLYLGVFPEDYNINANHLARLWLAEGLVKASENESFDAVANRYIQELMDRNLLMLSELSSCGRKIKRFRMHDLLQSFCTREAQKENLLHVIASEHSFDFPQKGFRWVSIQSEKFNISKIGSRSKSCRSFFYFWWEQSSFNFKNFNLLRVLYSRRICVRVKNIVDVVHLRLLWAPYLLKNIELSASAGLFLKSRCRKNIQLSRAWNLQTLGYISASYKSDDGENYTEFPQLQYIRCRGFFCGSPPKFVRELRWLSADNCSKEHIVNIPYLKKVHIGGERRHCNDQITNFAYLEQLEGLHIYGGGDGVRTLQAPINNHIVLLKNLRKLTIQNMGFEWKEINVLSNLPRLEVLKLHGDSCRGDEWEIPEEEVIFSNLIYLLIGYSGLKHWKASNHSFPKLERLILYRCLKLRKIPIDFEDIPTLKSIKLQWCLHCAVMSAKQIQEGQRDSGNENMIVIEEHTIKPPKNESD